MIKMKYFRHGHRIPFLTLKVDPDTVRTLGGHRLDLWRMAAAVNGRAPLGIRRGDRAEVGGYVYRFQWDRRGGLTAVIEEHKQR